MSNAAGQQLIPEWESAGPKRWALLFVNNRLEGNAIATIGAMKAGIASPNWAVRMLGRAKNRTVARTAELCFKNI